MIVNFQDFCSFLKKVNNGLGSFDEFMFPYPANPERQDKVFFCFAKLGEHKNPELNYPSTIDPLKILFYLPSQKVYSLKNHCVKRIMLGIITDAKKSMKSFLEIILKRIQRL
jgi:hypothetical protein